MSKLLSRFRGSKTSLAAADPHQNVDVEGNLSSAASPENVKQSGVEKIEGVASTWTKRGLAIAYLGVFLGSTLYALEIMTTFAYVPAATSAFKLHSGLATVSVVTNVLTATVKPIMAKVSDSFGRTEAFLLSIFLAILGFIMEAGSNNLSTYTASRVFGASGTTGITILIQIFIADTTSLLWRALFSSLPDVPYLFTTFAGPELASAIGTEKNWRWGYGMWAIIYPVAYLPLIWSLVVNQHKAKRLGRIPPKKYTGTLMANIKAIALDLDMLGLLLFTAGLIMLLVPLTLGKKWGWSNGRTVSLIVVGILTLIVFVVLETIPKITPRPMMSWRLLGDRTVGCSCALAFFYFFVYYLPSPFFYSWMQVVRNLSTTSAGNISNIFTLASCTTSILVSFGIRYTGNYKYWMLVGIPIYVLGYGLMIKFRTSDATLGQIIISQILTGVGGGTINVPAQLGLQAACAHTNVAVATAMFLTMANIGGAVGSAVSGAIWSNLLPGRLERHLDGMPAKVNVTNIYENYFAAMEYEWGTPERTAINRSYEEVFRIQLVAACCLAVPMLFFGLAMKNIDINAVNLHNVKGRVIGNIGKEGEASSAETLDSTEGRVAEPQVVDEKK